MTARILGLGTAQPTTGLDQSQALDMALGRCCQTDRHARLLPTLYRRTGVERRRAVALACDIDADPLVGAGPVRSAEDADVASDSQGSAAMVTIPAAAESDDGDYRFYPIPTSDTDRGPSTGQRMQRYADLAPPLAADAARSALGDANLDPARVTHLVTCSCTGFFAPGVDIALVKSLGLPAGVSRTHIGFMGCHAAFNAMTVAREAVEADPDAVALVVAVELCSLHFGYGFDPQQVVANALFADGAGAAVVAGREGERTATSGHAQPRFIASASRLFEDSGEAMTWTIGDHGFRMTLEATVPGLIERNLRGWVEPWLAGHGLELDDVARWAVHPGGPRILESVTDALGLPRAAADVSRAVLRESGNMSSATVLFILERMLCGREAKGPVVALGFGPGLMGEAMLMHW